jgi:hypothetical protein
MANLSPEVQRHIGIELRALYAASSDQLPDRLVGLLRQLEDKLEPSTKDEDTGRQPILPFAQGLLDDMGVTWGQLCGGERSSALRF